MGYDIFQLNLMSLIDFLREIIDNEKDFITIILAHTFECIVTLLVLRVIIFAVDILFTEENILVYCAETGAHIGVLAIFLIQTIVDIIKIWKKRMYGSREDNAL